MLKSGSRSRTLFDSSRFVQTHLSQLLLSECRKASWCSGFLRFVANQLCKRMFYIMTLFISGGMKGKQKSGRYISKLKWTCLCSLYSKFDIRLAWKVRGHICDSNPCILMCRLTHTHTHTMPPLSWEPLCAFYATVCGLRRDVARCGCKLTAVTQFCICLPCSYDTLAVALVTRTLPSIPFLCGKSCQVEFGLTP